MHIFQNNRLIFLLIIFLLLFIILIWSKIECKSYVLTTFDIKSKKLIGKFKIVFISDFHNKFYKNYYIDIISDIANINPDYIILGGDFINFSKIQNIKNSVDLDNSKEFIQKLAFKFTDIKNYNLKKIFFCYGNHELRLKQRTDNKDLIDKFNGFKEFLLNNNIYILDNDTYNSCDFINISASSLYDGYYSKFLNKKNKCITKEELDKNFKSIDKNCFNIVAFHKPDYAEDFINYGFDLVLSGHNHGGLIYFPFVGAFISSDLKILPKYGKGLYKYKDGYILVSGGLGEHTIRLRINNIPEINVININ